MSIQQVLESRPKQVREAEERKWRVEGNMKSAERLRRKLKGEAMEEESEGVVQQQEDNRGGLHTATSISTAPHQSTPNASSTFTNPFLASTEAPPIFPSPKPFLWPTPRPPPTPPQPFNLAATAFASNSPHSTSNTSAESRRAGKASMTGAQLGEHFTATMETDDGNDADSEDEDGDVMVVTPVKGKEKAPEMVDVSPPRQQLPASSSSPIAFLSKSLPFAAPQLSQAQASSSNSLPSQPLPLPALPASSATASRPLKPSQYRSATHLTRGRTRKPRKPQSIRRKGAGAELFDYLDDSDDGDSSDEGAGWGERRRFLKAGDDWTPAPPAPGTYEERRAKRKAAGLGKGGRALPGKDQSHLPSTAEGGSLKPRLPLTTEELSLLPASRAHAEKLVPTSYQTALLEKAKQGNVITCMPTGSGKTLVGVLLMDYVHTVLDPQRLAHLQSTQPITVAEQPKPQRPRLQFFLTNSVPLVHQQANILAHNTSLRVGKLFGGLGVNLSNDEEWAHNVENYDCLVLTAQLLLDSLAHGFIGMQDISLMVFDEAHHAKTNHPFASILRDFYHRAPPYQRPKILGLTASPINSSEGLLEAEKLQQLFNARLVTAPPETLSELREMVAQPTVLHVTYASPPPYRPTALTKSVLEKILAKDDQFRKYERAAETALRDYGPDAQDLIWHLVLQRYKQKYYPELLEDVELEQETITIQPTPKPDDPEFVLIHPEKDIVMEEKEKGEEEEEEEDQDEPMEVELPEWLREIQHHRPSLSYNNLSPKFQCLVKLLAACKPGAETFCGIIFVNRRMDALLIAQILKELTRIIPELDWIRVDCVTGHGHSGPGGGAFGPKMAWSEQASVLTAFGEGDTNLLVATSVVEEGLDVQLRCADLLSYTSHRTHISYVQSRGRARSAGSHYILFVEEGNISEQRKLVRIANFDKGISDLLNQVETSYEQADYGDLDDDAPEADYLIENSTNAQVTPHFAISLLQRYCQSLPVSDAFITNKPKFELVELYDKRVTCSITFPTSARIRTVISEPCLDGKLAKRAASFVACKVLRNIGALDDHLLPLHLFAEEEAKDEEGRTIGSRKRQIGYEKKRADAWTPEGPFAEQTTLYGTLLHYDGPGGTMTFEKELYRPLMLLTRARLPATPKIKLFIGGEAVFVSASPLPGTFVVSKQQRVVLRGWNLRVWLSVLNRMIDIDGEKMNYFVALLKADCSLAEPLSVDSLDWSSMEHSARIQEDKLDWKDLSALGDSVVVDAGKNDCRYFFNATHDELHPKSDLPPGRQSDAGFTNVLDYYMSFNEQLFHRYNIKDEQPLLEVSRMPKVVTYLSATPSNNVTPSQKRLLQKTPRFAIPQLCSVHSLPASIFRTALMLPSLLTELDQVLLVDELNQRVFKSAIYPALVRMSLMTPSACLEEDYERLELLGDAFLKTLCSIDCFVTMEKTCHEGELHRKRLHRISNSALFVGGRKLNLPAYLVSRPFTSRQFLPPAFELLKGQPPPQFTTIGDKTIAVRALSTLDVVEALLGAAYETGFNRSGLRDGFETALQAAIALHVEVTHVKSWDDFAKIYGEIPARATVAETPVLIEEKLAHRFVHGHLLTEALTHPSKLNAVVSFQRLEWLGDGILDFMVVRYCWTRWGTLPPSHLTELKGACLSNETLAAIAVEYELDKWLAFDNAALAKSLEVYRGRITNARDAEIVQAAQEQRQLRPYWLLADPPKAVADIVESLFGAVLVDSGFDPSAPQRSFDHLLVPFFAKWVTPTSLKIDAIRILLERAQGVGCDDVSHISSTVEPRLSEDGSNIIQPRLTRTSVICHNVVLATVETANPKTAKRLVSAEALGWLEANPAFFANKCDCSHTRAIKAEEAAEEEARRRNEGLISDPSSDEDENDEREEVGEGGGEGAGVVRMES
ncbi:hypothetical protein BCR35DRAFT_303884 [Leucosporidium creatinivorum]|uniref:P-loop containing nucleoside triphosphate hydrolase protein n=1 Tax=Leucosporidium creatinivorum TaxID=106004 RepID=A0A1Y2FCW1_9BASI|nr:hypothetical protein BCR35DRAFT_303884 [Leucosporidium creatinivorum]